MDELMDRQTDESMDWIAGWIHLRTVETKSSVQDLDLVCGVRGHNAVSMVTDVRREVRLFHQTPSEHCSQLDQSTCLRMRHLLCLCVKEREAE